MRDKNKTSVSCGQQGGINPNESRDNTTASQRARVLEKLQSVGGSINRFEAEQELDIVALAPRIWELRHIYGYNIIKKFERNGFASSGRPHSVARYFLLTGKWKETNKK